MAWTARLTKHRAALLAAMLMLLPAVTAAVELPDYSKHYDPQRNPFSDGRAALALAAKTQRRVLIEVGGDWCNWCKVLQRFIDTTPDVRRVLHRNFVVLKVNVSDENDNHEFLAGLPRATGYPHVFISDDKGTLLYSGDVTDLVQNGRFSAPLFLRFLEHWKPQRGTGI